MTTSGRASSRPFRSDDRAELPLCARHRRRQEYTAVAGAFRAVAKAALDEAIGSDRGDAIVAAQIGHLPVKATFCLWASAEHDGLRGRKRVDCRALQGC